MAIDMIQDDAASVFDAGTVIKVIGVGGGGGKQHQGQATRKFS